MTVLDHWNNFKRILLVICAVLMWVMSIVFSYIGFKADVQTEWYFGIFALILSATITSLELYLNSQTFDFNEVDMGLVILWIGGFAAYAYGIWTNVVGVGMMMLGGDLTTVKWSAQVVPIIVGILLEVLPEPMFVAFLKTKAVRKQPNQQQQKQHHIPIPPPNPVKQLDTVSPRFDPKVLADLRRTQPYRPMSSKR